MLNHGNFMFVAYLQHIDVKQKTTIEIMSLMFENVTNFNHKSHQKCNNLKSLFIEYVKLQHRTHMHFEIINLILK